MVSLKLYLRKAFGTTAGKIGKHCNVPKLLHFLCSRLWFAPWCRSSNSSRFFVWFWSKEILPRQNDIRIELISGQLFNKEGDLKTQSTTGTSGTHKGLFLLSHGCWGGSSGSGFRRVSECLQNVYRKLGSKKLVECQRSAKFPPRNIWMLTSNIF